MASCENPATDKDALMLRRPKFDKSKECVRCKVKTGNIVVRYAVYCKECFFPLIATKFRRSLEPSINAIPDGPRRKGLKATGNLLLGFSGGLGSATLLDLVYRSYFSAHTDVDDGGGKLRGGKDHPRNASVWPKAAVCYVEVCSAFPGMKDNTEAVRAVVQKYEQLNFVPLRIEDAFDGAWWEQVGGKPTQSELGMDVTNEDLFLSSLANPSDTHSSIFSLRTYISSLPTQTAIQSAIQTLTRLLLLHTAESTGSSHLLLGTSLTSLSISLISSIAQGGGFVVREEAQEEWTPHVSVERRRAKGNKKRSIRIIRPLRDIGKKECAIWTWWHGLAVPGREKVPGEKQDIGMLTKAFIMGLERDYPSTVSTIARTCAKLTPKEGTDGTCMLCERPAQHGVQEWKARISIRSFTDPHAHSPHEVIPSPSDKELTPPAPSLTPYLCYACHTTLTSRSSRGSTSSEGTQQDLVPLPVWVNSQLRDSAVNDRTIPGNGGESEVWKQTRRAGDDMKDAIKEFLLDD